jgi:hypothetical protein
MKLDEYLQVLERLTPVLRRERGRQISSVELKNRLRAIAETWPNNVRPQLPAHEQASESVNVADGLAGKIIEATYHHTTATKYIALFGALRAAAIRLKVEVAVVPPTPTRPTTEEGTEVERALEAFNPAIADSYRQVLWDLSDGKRLSHRGTANELREILREVLDGLAPNDKVKKEGWYQVKDEFGQEKSRPTHADRAKYAVRLKGKNKNAQKVAAASVQRADELLGGIVRSTYDRGSGASHAEAERDEIISQLRYVNAILLDLLP